MIRPKQLLRDIYEPNTLSEPQALVQTIQEYMTAKGTYKNTVTRICDRF